MFATIQKEFLREVRLLNATNELEGTCKLGRVPFTLLRWREGAGVYILLKPVNPDCLLVIVCRDNG